jgi:hypothetical protein
MRFLGDVSPAVGSPWRGTAMRRRGRRRHTRALVAVGVIVGAAGVAAALLATSDSGEPSALAVVTGALTKTSATSYSFSLDSTVQVRGEKTNSDVVSGAVDPGRELGTEELAVTGQRPAQAQIRFIGGYVYTRVSPGSAFPSVGRPWDKAPVPPVGTNEMPGAYGFVSDQLVSPAELSAMLQSEATVRNAGPASGPGWTGTGYTFTARLFDGQESVTGTVYIDRRGQVRRLATITIQGVVTTDRDLTFGDFGAPVPVSAPPADQAKYTSTPYWGFYF